MIKGQAIVFKKIIDNPYFNKYKFYLDKIYYVHEVYIDVDHVVETIKIHVFIFDEHARGVWFFMDELKESIYTLFDLI